MKNKYIVSFKTESGKTFYIRYVNPASITSNIEWANMFTNKKKAESYAKYVEKYILSEKAQHSVTKVETRPKREKFSYEKFASEKISEILAKENIEKITKDNYVDIENFIDEKYENLWREKDTQKAKENINENLDEIVDAFLEWYSYKTLKEIFNEKNFSELDAWYKTQIMHDIIFEKAFEMR